MATNQESPSKPGLAALWVPALVILGVLASFAQYSARKAHEKAEWAHCGDLPLTWQMYVFAYGALLCGLGAVVAYIQLARRAHRTPTVFSGWRGTLALVSMLLGIFPLLGEAFVVWSLYQPAPGGPITCV